MTRKELIESQAAVLDTLEDLTVYAYPEQTRWETLTDGIDLLDRILNCGSSADEELDFIHDRKLADEDIHYKRLFDSFSEDLRNYEKLVRASIKSR